jgi:hypothetical protein
MGSEGLLFFKISYVNLILAGKSAEGGPGRARSP